MSVLTKRPYFFWFLDHWPDTITLSQFATQLKSLSCIVAPRNDWCFNLWNWEQVLKEEEQNICACKWWKGITLGRSDKTSVTFSKKQNQSLTWTTTWWNYRILVRRKEPNRSFKLRTLLFWVTGLTVLTETHDSIILIVCRTVYYPLVAGFINL